jgi:hypothetical protein
MRHPIRTVLTVLAVAIPLQGCALLAPTALEVTAEVERSEAAPDEPAIVRVTATNRGSRRVRWGEGSSTCQLWLVVRVDGVDRRAPMDRVCTMDLRPHTLEPGESRTEVVGWTGLVQIGHGPDAVHRLPAGEYEVRGAAGWVAASAPVIVTLRDAP